MNKKAVSSLMIRLKVKALSLSVLFLFLAFLAQSGALFAANEERTGSGASAAVQLAKIDEETKNKLLKPRAAKLWLSVRSKPRKLRRPAPPFSSKRSFLKGI